MTCIGGGRAWAYLGAALGGLVSIGANTAHSYVPPSGAPADWRPPAGAVVGAVFWPIALFVTIEIFARTSWPSARRWLSVRLIGLVPVALVAAAVSYSHLSGLLAYYGEDRLTVLIGPLAVDGLMVMSSAAILATMPERAGTAGEPASEGIYERPPERVLEPTKKRGLSARKRAARKRTEEQLLAEAYALNQAAFAEKGAPVSKRALMSALHVGQPTADRIHAALVQVDRQPSG